MKSACLIPLLMLAAPLRSPAADPATILAELEARYAEDRAVSLRLVLGRYADELDALQNKLLQAGDASGAARVQLERDRILPALGLPVVAAENADEFAAFEDAPALPPLPQTAPAVTPRNLDAILKTLLPPPPAAASVPGGDGAKPATGTGSGPEGMPRKGRRVLRMSEAQLLGSYDPVYGYVYWSAGRSAAWTLNDLPPGSYTLHIRYSCDDKDGGGRLKAKFGGTTLEAEVAPTGGWKRRRELMLGPFAITGSRTDLSLESVSIRTGASYLMDLTSVMVLPEGVSYPPP